MEANFTRQKHCSWINLINKNQIYQSSNQNKIVDHSLIIQKMFNMFQFKLLNVLSLS